MQFIVIAYDHKDVKAIERRLAARADHVALGDKMRDEGKLLYAVAILNDQDQMIGSVMILDLPSRKDLNEWLSIEPYVKGQVWDEIDIRPCRVGPSFTKQ